MAVQRGCLLVALGTPASPAPEDIRIFLREFLSDPAVVDFPAWLWKPILHQIVLRVRPKKIAPTYAAIWFPDGSPLEVYTKAQAHALSTALPDVSVKYAMTYTQPSIAQAIAEFREAGVAEVTVLPLYPHYAPSTVADIYRQVKLVRREAAIPQVKIIPQWPTHLPYIEWYQQQLRAKIAQRQPQRIIFSYHGVPQRKAHQPAAYQEQCLQTSAAIMRGLADLEIAFETTFQSKFGPGKWLAPATLTRMQELPTEGVKDILIATPGFIADCIETIDELDELNQAEFLAAGGEKYRRIAPLNDAAAAGEILATLYQAHYQA